MSKTLQGSEPINTSANTLDSRDIEARIDYLEPSAGDPTSEDEEERNGTLDEDERAELAMLRTFRDDCRSREWPHGVCFISDSYFEAYAEELASDISDYDSRNVRWPFTCIDWEKAARDLQMDYSSCELDGTTYWYRG